jgi:hypothetical protein
MYYCFVQIGCTCLAAVCLVVNISFDVVLISVRCKCQHVGTYISDQSQVSVGCLARDEVIQNNLLLYGVCI